MKNGGEGIWGVPIMKTRVEVVFLVDLNRIVTRKGTMLIQIFMTNIVKTTIMMNVRFIKEVLHRVVVI